MVSLISLPFFNRTTMAIGVGSLGNADDPTGLTATVAFEYDLKRTRSVEPLGRVKSLFCWKFDDGVTCSLFRADSSPRDGGGQRTPRPVPCG